MPSVALTPSLGTLQPSTGRRNPWLRDGPRRSVRVVTPPALDASYDPFSACPIHIGPKVPYLSPSRPHSARSAHSAPDLHASFCASGLAGPAARSPPPTSPPVHPLPLPPTPSSTRTSHRSSIKALARQRRESCVPSGVVITPTRARPVRTGNGSSVGSLRVIWEDAEDGACRSARQRMRDERRRREGQPVRGAGDGGVVRLLS